MRILLCIANNPTLEATAANCLERIAQTLDFPNQPVLDLVITIFEDERRRDAIHVLRKQMFKRYSRLELDVECSGSMLNMTHDLCEILRPVVRVGLSQVRSDVDLEKIHLAGDRNVAFRKAKPKNTGIYLLSLFESDGGSQLRRGPQSTR